MKEQTYRIEKIDSFELRDIFECGQCFRWNEENDGSYTGIFRETVLNVKIEGKEIIFAGISSNDMKEEVEDYFDLDRDYEEIKRQLQRYRY